MAQAGFHHLLLYPSPFVFFFFLFFEWYALMEAKVDCARPPTCFRRRKPYRRSQPVSTGRLAPSHEHDLDLLVYKRPRLWRADESYLLSVGRVTEQTSQEVSSKPDFVIIMFTTRFPLRPTRLPGRTLLHRDDRVGVLPAMCAKSFIIFK